VSTTGAAATLTDIADSRKAKAAQEEAEVLRQSLPNCVPVGSAGDDWNGGLAAAPLVASIIQSRGAEPIGCCDRKAVLSFGLPTVTGSVMHRLIDQHRAEIAMLCRRFGVRQLEVFGSAARSADFDPATSDADFLVDFEPGGDLSPLEQFFGLADALRSLLGRPVDLVERGAVRNPFILAGINQACEVVYEA
jgi:hypothetical protein